MNRLAIEPVSLHDIYTTNRLERLNSGYRNRVHRMLRTRAAAAWCDAAAGISAPADQIWDFPIVFCLETIIGGGSTLPDADAFGVVGKRFLDGARDAGVIPDDSPEYIRRIVLEAPAWGAVAGGSVAHVATLSVISP